MGAFRSKPIVDKDSSDGGNEKLKWGACSMQGWRLTQEDAHNCILDYDVNTSFFAVYDGHGGHEVSQYCSERLPDFIKNTEAYKAGDIEKALVDGYLGFDGTLVKEDVVQQLKRMAQDKPPEETDDSEDENEDISEMFEEACMPIEEVIEKYRTGVEEKREKRNKNTPNEGSPSSDSSSLSLLADIAAAGSSGSSKSSDKEASNSDTDNEKKDDAGQSLEVSESSSKNGAPDSTENKPEPPKDTESPTEKTDELADSSTCLNGAVTTSDEKEAETVQENGNINVKGKGKALAKTKGITPLSTSIKSRLRKTASDLYKQFLSSQCDDEESESSSEDEDDKPFESPHEDCSEDDSEDVNNVTVNEEEDEDDTDDVAGEDDDDDEEEEEEEEDEDDEHSELGAAFKGDFMKHSPGMDSGCTAVVAVLKGNDLYVANAGDSRCVVCKKGVAFPMSFDHKPCEEIEYQRIKKAGGRIDCDKRVNGGLNLSRAIGDHAYKQNQQLSDREQMITALPDIKKITINPEEDEFMVLACDGIWDCYSNQEVVDFVRQSLQEGKEKLSQICEEMFDSCLSKYKFSDLGSDNMTAIIIQFGNSLNNLKRPLPSSSAAVAEKRAKTDQSETNVDTTV